MVELFESSPEQWSGDRLIHVATRVEHVHIKGGGGAGSFSGYSSVKPKSCSINGKELREMKKNCMLTVTIYRYIPACLQ